MQIQSVHPPEEQRLLFREFYYFSIAGDASNRERPVIDDCCYDLIFYKEGKANLIHGPAHASLDIPYQIFTIHDLNPPYRFRFNGPLTFFTIKLQPWANSLFFGELRDPGVHDMGKVQPQWRSWHSRLFKAGSAEGILNTGSQIFQGHVPELSPEAQWVRELCLEIYKAGGNISVQELSDQHGLSRQHLGRVFRQHVLYSLKHFILTVRMLELVKCRMKKPDISLTELAHQFEYFDQSHFIRDFRKFCGMTPTDFFADPPEFLERH